MKNKIGILLLAVIALAGCDQNGAYDKALDQAASEHKAEIEFSKNHFADLQAHNFAAIEAKVDASLKDEQLQKELETMAALFPAQPATNVKLIGFTENVTKTTAGDISEFSVTFQYEFPGKYLQAQIVFQGNAPDFLILGTHVDETAEPLESINKFTFQGKGAAHFSFLAAAILFPLFIIATLITCVRTRGLKRKWLWFVFILFGLTSASLDWTTGAIYFNPLYFQLLAAGFMKSSPYTPLTLSISLPLGAIVFWLCRKKLSSA